MVTEQDVFDAFDEVINTIKSIDSDIEVIEHSPQDGGEILGVIVYSLKDIVCAPILNLSYNPYNDKIIIDYGSIHNNTVNKRVINKLKTYQKDIFELYRKYINLNNDYEYNI